MKCIRIVTPVVEPRLQTSVYVTVSVSATVRQTLHVVEDPFVVTEHVSEHRDGSTVFHHRLLSTTPAKP